MKKISGNIVWSKPVSLSRAAKLISRFSAVETGASAAVSLYLHRTSEAFNQLVQFHNKNLMSVKIEENPSSPVGGTVNESDAKVKKESRTAEEENVSVKIELGSEELGQNERKKKKRKERSADGKKEKKQRRVEAFDS